MEDREERRTPDPVMQVDDQGLASPSPTPTTVDEEPASALGGGTATRSGVPEDEEDEE